MLPRFVGFGNGSLSREARMGLMTKRVRLLVILRHVYGQGHRDRVPFGPLSRDDCVLLIDVLAYS
jgi:hypothetical protein